MMRSYSSGSSGALHPRHLVFDSSHAVRGCAISVDDFFGDDAHLAYAEAFLAILSRSSLVVLSVALLLVPPRGVTFRCMGLGERSSLWQMSQPNRDAA
jgi:hypothetical protein